MAPQSDDPFRAEAALLAWPGLRAMRLSTPAQYWRTPAMVVNHSGLIALSQGGAEISIGAGEALGVLHAAPSTLTTSQVDYIAFGIPRAALVPFVADVEGSTMRLIPRDNEALLLTRYVRILPEDPMLVTPELRRVAVTHAHDLIAMALGATRDGAEIACGRGVRAARLRAVKANILEHLGSLELTVTAVALRERVTPRYVHMLFEAEGTTFSEFVLSQRLTRAHRMLSDSRFAALTISTIAFAVGFGDLSYFNRTFRRRFGATPSASEPAQGSAGHLEDCRGRHASTNTPSTQRRLARGPTAFSILRWSQAVGITRSSRASTTTEAATRRASSPAYAGRRGRAACSAR
jgi:AraC-like DNA-binding protein